MKSSNPTHLEDWTCIDRLVALYAAILISCALLHIFIGLGNIVHGIKGWLFSPAAAGWAQAFGTFLAVAATGLGALYEARKRRIEAAKHAEAEALRAEAEVKRERDRLMAKLSITELFSKRLSHYVKLFALDERGREIRLKKEFGALRALLSDASAIELREMPFSRAVNQLAEIKGAIESVRVILDEIGASPPTPKYAARMKVESGQITSKLLQLQYMIDPEGMGARAQQMAARRG